jgi:tight adherence protein C
MLLPLLAFVFGSLLIGALVLKLSGGQPAMIERRLGEVTGTAVRPEAADPRFEKTAIDVFKRFATVAPKSVSEMSRLRQRLIAAGYRGTDALVIFLGVRVGSAAAAFFLFMTPTIVRPSLPTALVAAGLAYVVPGMLLARMAKRRQHRIRLGLPDALDLLVVSVEAGLGLDQALQRVAAELSFAHPDLCDELRLINLELRAGKARAEALHNLAERTGVDDVGSLVAMLVQTDKFGTSVAQSLRVHSDTLRTKRRQRAEEAAAKTGVKMVFPLVLCIFPAIYVVTLAPAAIRFMRVLGPMGQK